MSAKSAATLHITNGDAVLYLFKKAGIAGTQIAWQDGLYEGPVPAGLSLPETSAVRARFLSERGYGNPIKIIYDFQRRDSQIAKAHEFEEIVLWFEHDLYDQLQLLQLLTTLEEMQLEPGRVSLVASDHYLGTMTADELSPLLGRRRTVTPAIFKSARRAWERFTASSPPELHAAANEESIGLPFLKAAMLRLCEEFPWRRDGLSRSQRQALEAVARGPAELQELFRRAQAREESSFLADTAFAKIVEDLQQSSAPLVEGDPGLLETTSLGRRLLAGDADWLESLQIDRWIGGNHLVDGAVRWDDDARRFAASD